MSFFHFDFQLSKGTGNKSVALERAKPGRGKSRQDDPFDFLNPSGPDNKQQVGAISNQLGLMARGMILNRVNKGMMLASRAGGGSLVRIPEYSRRKLSVPVTKSAWEEPAPSARRKYSQMLKRAQSRLETFGVLSSRRRSARERKTGKGRKWITMPHGYAQLKMLAGLGLNQKLRFTGKMLEDLRVRADIKSIRGSKRTKGSLFTSVFGTLSQAFGKGARGFAKQGVKKFFDDSLPLYEIGIRFGFATLRSARIAQFQSISGRSGRRGFRKARPFVGLADPELREFRRQARRIFIAAAQDKRFKGKSEDLRIPQPRGKGGKFIPIRY